MTGMNIYCIDVNFMAVVQVENLIKEHQFRYGGIEYLKTKNAWLQRRFTIKGEGTGFNALVQDLKSLEEE